MARSLLSTFLVAATVVPFTSGSAFTVKTRVPAAFQPASPDVPSDHVLQVKKSNQTSKSSGYMKALFAGPDGEGKYRPRAHYGAGNIDNLDGYEYTAEIQWDQTAFEVIVDTGSSSTWLIQQNYTCYSPNVTVQTEAFCNLGPTFNGTYQYGQIPNVNFAAAYGSGEQLRGTVGYEDITVAGITVENQTVALVDIAVWTGDGVTSGLMGLAYPALTGEFNGTSDTTDNFNYTQIEYDPIFTTMSKQGVPPVFSIAQQRDTDQGYIAFGGLPPVRTTGPFASTPILIVCCVETVLSKIFI